MNAEHNRAERLAMESWPITADLSDDVEQYRERAAFVDGYIASKQLTEAEWAEKCEQVARALNEHSQVNVGGEFFRAPAESAMTALGFTKQES